MLMSSQTRGDITETTFRARTRGKEGEHTLDEDSDLEDREGLQDDDGWGPSDIPPPRPNSADVSDEEYATSAEDDNVPSDWSDQGRREPWDLDPKRRHYRTGKRLSDEEYRLVQQSTSTPQKFKKVRNRRVLSLEQREREREWERGGRQPYRPDWMLSRKRRVPEGGSREEDVPPRQRPRLEDQPAEGQPPQVTPALAAPAMKGLADTGGLPVPSGNATPPSTGTNAPATGVISLPGAKEQEPTPRTLPTSIIPEPTPGPTSEPRTEPAPTPTPTSDPSREPTSQPERELPPEQAPEPALEPAPEPTPGPAPEPTSEPAPESAPESAPEPTRDTVPDPKLDVAHGGETPLSTPGTGQSNAAGAAPAPTPDGPGPKPRPRPKPVQRKKPTGTSNGPASALVEGDAGQTPLKDGEARNGHEDARVQNEEELDAVLASGFDGRSLAGVVEYIKTLEISQRASERDLVVSVLESLATLSPDPRWESILKRWAYLECQLGFPPREVRDVPVPLYSKLILFQDPSHKLSTTSRPGQCSWWMRNARRKLTTVPDIRKEELAAYGESMRGWFRSWMPAWRSPRKNWPLLREKPEGETWARARKGGTGGVFVAVIAVGWWIKQAVTPAVRKQAWVVAEDLLWALGELADLDN